MRRSEKHDDEDDAGEPRPSGKVASIASRKGLWAVDAGDQDVVDAAGIES